MICITSVYFRSRSYTFWENPSCCYLLKSWIYAKYNFYYVGMTCFFWRGGVSFPYDARHFFGTREREGGSDIRHFYAEVVFPPLLYSDLKNKYRKITNLQPSLFICETATVSSYITCLNFSKTPFVLDFFSPYGCQQQLAGKLANKWSHSLSNRQQEC